MTHGVRHEGCEAEVRSRVYCRSVDEFDFERRDELETTRRWIERAQTVLKFLLAAGSLYMALALQGWQRWLWAVLTAGQVGLLVRDWRRPTRVD